MRRICIVLAIVLGVCAAAAPAASAATEFGDGCTANEASSGEEVTLFEISAPGNPLPVVAPVSGVLTQWKISLITAPISVSTTMQVYRLNPTTKTLSVIGESTGQVVPGLNTFSTRIPIQAGDRIGLVGHSEIGTLLCETVSEIGHYGGFEGSATTGATVPYLETSGKVRIPAVGVIEPDADGDGYGDETQDKCPQSAATQAACPAVKLSLSKIVKKSSVKLLVSANAATSVKVTGKVKAGGQKLTLKGGKKTVKPGKITAFKLTFPAGLISALGDLPRSHSLSLKIVLSAKNLTGKATVKKLTVKLKGQG
jgi:hypothetical protein